MRVGNRCCKNSAKVDGYCNTHHPESVKAREEASSAKYMSVMDRRMMNARKAANIDRLAAMLADIARDPKLAGIKARVLMNELGIDGKGMLT